jgi:biopolymer transport protein TolR
MAMTVSGNGKLRADINVTPMIDVLLVLLIIFMVVAPVESVGLRALVPEPAPSDEKARPADVVITMDQSGAIEINQQPVALKDLPDRLKSIFKSRGDIVVFLRGAKNLQYGQVAHVIDIARGAGLDRVALMTG